MKREVLRARRRWFTPGTLILCGWLSGCAAGIAAHRAPSPGVPLSTWTIDFTPDCAPQWMRPGLLCVPQIQPRWNDCRWTCDVEVGQ